MDLLNEPGIDLLSKEKLKNDSTSGWIATDYVKFIKMTLWMCRNCDRILEQNLSLVSTTHIKQHNRKVYTVSSNLVNLEVPQNFKDKTVG